MKYLGVEEKKTTTVGESVTRQTADPRLNQALESRLEE
jgi:hypothetical protein